MRKALTWVLSLVVLIGTLSTAGAATAAEPETGDIKDRLLAIPGVSLIEEKPYPGYRFFVLNFTQPIDHRRPSKGTFQQRITMLHKDTARPTVFFTSGYNVSTTPRRSEPTQIVDGNQISMEYRFFTPSRPDPANWSKLDIWQAASDQHRIFKAFKKIYDKKWVSTGGSKGGMTATYYERFYPRDPAPGYAPGRGRVLGRAGAVVTLSVRRLRWAAAGTGRRTRGPRRARCRRTGSCSTCRG
jgi:hypothetical protein